jgi:hypothetical protein
MKLRRNKIIPRTLFAALAIATAIGAWAPESHACGGGWFADPALEIEWRDQGIVRAEKQLESGKYNDAAGTVLRVIPHIANYDKATKDPVINRAMRVLALATARQNGKLDVKKQVFDVLRTDFLSKTETHRTNNLAWSAKMLRAINDTKKDDAIAQSELGEALAKTDDGRAEAQKLLERLANKDLLTSPEAYKVLAQLREKAGDKDGRIAALKRCRAMAEDNAMCGAA